MAPSRQVACLLLGLLACCALVADAQLTANTTSSSTVGNSPEADKELAEVQQALLASGDSTVEVAAIQSSLWQKALKYGKCIIGKSLVDCAEDSAYLSGGRWVAHWDGATSSLDYLSGNSWQYATVFAFRTPSVQCSASHAAQSCTGGLHTITVQV